MRARLVVCALALIGCSHNELTLGIDLKTDFVPGIEFTSVEIEITRAGEPAAIVDTATRGAAMNEPFDDAVRVRELELPAGAYDVRVRLRDPQRALLVERLAVVRFERSYAALVFITRDCRGVRCPLEGGDPGLTACYGGRCVSPDCSPQNLEACMITCTDASTQCGVLPACVQARCEGGVCFREGSDAACPTGQWCNPEVGCEVVPELPDAGPPTCGTSCDDGLFCTGTESCSGGACVSSGNPCAAPQVCEEANDRCVTSSCGVCSPGAEEWGGGCGSCGTEHRVCGSGCAWGNWTCEGQGACSPGSSETGGGCGRCGTDSRTCNSDCTWGGWSCGGQGSCQPGAEEWGAGCGACQQQHRTCHGGCEWNGWQCRLEPGAECTGGREASGGSCACSGWEAQRECQSCRWVDIGCQDVGGGAPCGTLCSGDFECRGAGRFCECWDGTLSCEPIGSC